MLGFQWDYCNVRCNGLCRKDGTSNATYYDWKAKYAGMSMAELRRLKELEAENSKLKRLAEADSTRQG